MKIELVIFDTPENSKKGTLKGLTAMAILICLDLIWFRIVKKIHDKTFNGIKTPKIRWIGAFFAWLLIASALSVLNPKNIEESIAYGALIGLVIYGTYNGTNYATINNWNIPMALSDTIWGITNCIITSIILFLIFKKV